MRDWKFINTANGDICEFSDEELKHLMVYYDFDFCQQKLSNNKLEYVLVDGSFYCNISQYYSMSC
jgi:hypothetical protein